MQPNDSLDRLAAFAGIEFGYFDVFGNENRASEETKRRLLRAMGFRLDDESMMLRAALDLENLPWQRILEPVAVLRCDTDGIDIAITLPADAAYAECEWQVSEEQGRVHHGRWDPSLCALVERREIDGRPRERRIARIPVALPLGYHEVKVSILGVTPRLSGVMTLIIVPERCHLPEDPDARVFGLAVQLYSLRSAQNFGIGDFTDLATLASIASGHGVGAIGLNPLHELDQTDPGAISPYSPISRYGLNPTYIDVTAVPEFAHSEVAQAILADESAARAIGAAREAEVIDYASVVTIKMRVLEACFETFRTRELSVEGERAIAFRDFLRASGTTLERRCMYRAFHEHFRTRNLWGPSQWPEPYRNSESRETALLAFELRDRVEFFAYLQFEAERGLQRARDAMHAMPIGLYTDLAVGVDSSSADAWAFRDAFVEDVGVGAPPDLLSTAGQGWGLAPFSPIGLRECGYMPFAELLRANMRRSSALRIDHVMSLVRLFWIPNGSPASEGAYVRYPFEDLLGIVALESVRARCLVVGEDLGTVPDGFRDRMERAGVLSYRIFSFERGVNGEFADAADYPRLALAATGTHDMPTLVGWWLGRDIELRARLGLTQDRGREDARRARERDLMLDALGRNGDLTLEGMQLLRGPDARSIRALATLVLAAGRFVARTPSMLMMMQAEDIFGVADPVNVPGTINEVPNWRRKLPVSLEDWEHDEGFLTLMRAMRALRPSPFSFNGTSEAASTTGLSSVSYENVSQCR